MPLGTSYGYPVKTADELGLTDYFRKNPKVAGMAWGGGLNGSDPKEPRAIVANPFNRYMADPNRMQGLLKIEAARHLMDETGYVPEFELSEEQQEWRKTLGKAYAEDDLAAKQTIVSRVLANDKVPGVTPEQKAEVEVVNKALQAREPDFVKSVMSGLNLRGQQQEEKAFLQDWLGQRDLLASAAYEVEQGGLGAPSKPKMPRGLSEAQDAFYRLSKSTNREVEQKQKQLETDPVLLVSEDIGDALGEKSNREGAYISKKFIENTDRLPPSRDVTSAVFSRGVFGDKPIIKLKSSLENYLLYGPDGNGGTPSAIGDNVLLHETVHHMDSYDDSKQGEQYLSNLIKNPETDFEKYLAEPNEIRARVFVLRKEAGLKPDQPVKNKDLDDFLIKGGQWNGSLPGYHDDQIRTLWQILKGDSYEKKRNNLRTLLNTTVSVDRKNNTSSA